MASNSISRRALLRGLGGVAVALPALEIMGGKGGLGVKSAFAAGAPQRYAFFYGAHNVGAAKYDSANGIPYQNAGNLLVPTATGANYALTTALAPLGPDEHDVKGDISIVSGLKIPWAVNGVVPAGGRCVEFHYGPSIMPQLSGMRVLSRSDRGKGSSSDQIVADAIAQGTRFRNLNYLVQAASYYQGSAGGGGAEARISWQYKNGKMAGLDAVTSPRLAYQSLFTGFTPPDPADAAKAQALLDRRKSVLDLVRGSSERLLPQLGAADAQRMQQHFDEIRSLENRLNQVSGPVGAGCAQLPSKADPAFTPSRGHSNENIRAQLFVDLIHMAFVCDLSRVAAYQFMYWKSYMNMGFIGINDDAHNVSHTYSKNLGVERTNKVLAWQVGEFARLTKKLKESSDGAGGTLLDNTAMVMVFEGGNGFDPEGGATRTFGPHSTENMVALIAGRAGGLKPGKHVAATNKHPAQVVLSAMTGVGVANNGKLGEVAGTLPQLFT